MPFHRSASAPLSERGGHVTLFTHPSGLRHLHLNDKMIPATFFIAFPTLPTRNDGVAHVLEHLVLSGSQAYPARELFSRLSERTMASFLNAFTTSTFTAYPFVSPHRADFQTILPVYLDAVFRPLLRSADFRQEGIRIEVDEKGQAHHQGVVFNEMKGAFENPLHHAHQALLRCLYPNSSLGCESGGDPLAIANLTAEQVRQFHSEHYHPSRAIIFTAGENALVDDVHEVLSPLLKTYDSTAQRPALTMDRSPLKGNMHRQQLVPSQDGTHAIVVAVRLGTGFETGLNHQLDVFGTALLLQDNSPWQMALQHSQVGRPGPLTGTLRIGEEHWLLIHVEGLKDGDQVTEAYNLFDSCMAEEANAPTLSMAAALRQFEGQQRMTLDVGGEGACGRFFPVTEAALFLRDAFPTILEGLDPLASMPRWAEPLQTQKHLHALMEGIRTSDRLALHLVPDAHFFQRRKDAEQALADEATRVLAGDEDAMVMIRRQMMKDQAWAHQMDEASNVPRTPLALIPPEATPTLAVNQVLPGVAHILADLKGVGSLTIMAELGHLSEEEACDVKYLMEVLVPKVGMGALDWQAAAAAREEVMTTFDSRVEGITDQAGNLRMGVIMGARGLTDHALAIQETLAQMLSETRLDEFERLTYLAETAAEELDESLPAHAAEWVHHQLMAGFTAKGAWLEQSEGLASIPHTRQWRDHFHRDSREAARVLVNLHAHLLKTLSWTVVAVGGYHWQQAAQVLRDGLIQRGMRVGTIRGSHTGRLSKPVDAMALALVSPNTQSRHMAVGWKAPGDEHPDAAPLMALAHVLNPHLWNRLRSQGGAYGAWASYDDHAFTVTSYRDPRFQGSLEDFEAVRQTAAVLCTQKELEDAQRAIFQKLDRPITPWDQAQRALRMAWQGRTDTNRQIFRERLLQLTPHQLVQAAERWLGAPTIHTVAYIPNSERKLATQLGLTLQYLPDV